MPRRPRTGFPAGTHRLSNPGTGLDVETGDADKDGQIWMSRIFKTLAARVEDENGDRFWQAAYDWFAGNQWLSGAGRRSNDWELYSDEISSVYTNNIVQSIASAFMPFLLAGDIRFRVKPTRPQDANAAVIQTALLNYEWGERGMTGEVKKIVDDVVIIGHGVGKTGYVVEVDEARRKDQGVIEYRDYVKRDAAFVERVSPFDFIFDRSARDGTLKTARWVAERSFIPLADLVANSRFDRDVAQAVCGGAGNHQVTLRNAFFSDARRQSARAAFFGSDLTVKVPEESLVSIWTIWDKKYRQVITLPEGVPHPLLVEPWPYDYLDGFPYVMITFLRAPNRLYPIGVARQLKDAQLHANRIRTQEIQNVRAQKNMFGADTNRLSKEAIDGFADLPALSLIPMQGEGGIFPIANPSMNRDILILEQSLQADARSATGADAIVQGQPLGDRTTAGEVSTRVNVFRLKADDKVSNVETGVVQLARQILQHLKANRTTGGVVEIAGLIGSQWKDYTTGEIQAEADVHVDFFAQPRVSEEIERQQRSQIFQLAIQAAPVMQQQGAALQIDFPALFGWLLDAFGDKSVGRFFKPALTVPPELTEQPAGAGAGLPPALAGQSAPQQLPGQPGVENPAEGFTTEDLLQAIRGLGGR